MPGGFPPVRVLLLAAAVAASGKFPLLHPVPLSAPEAPAPSEPVPFLPQLKLKPEPEPPAPPLPEPPSPEFLPQLKLKPKPTPEPPAPPILNPPSPKFLPQLKLKPKPTPEPPAPPIPDPPSSFASLFSGKSAPAPSLEAPPTPPKTAFEKSGSFLGLFQGKSKEDPSVLTGSPPEAPSEPPTENPPESPETPPDSPEDPPENTSDSLDIRSIMTEVLSEEQSQLVQSIGFCLPEVIKNATAPFQCVAHSPCVGFEGERTVTLPDGHVFCQESCPPGFENHWEADMTVCWKVIDGAPAKSRKYAKKYKKYKG